MYLPDVSSDLRHINHKHIQMIWGLLKALLFMENVPKHLYLYVFSQTFQETAVTAVVRASPCAVWYPDY